MLRKATLPGGGQGLGGTDSLTGDKDVCGGHVWAGGNAPQGTPQERLSGQDDSPWVSPSPSTPRSDLQGRRPLPRAHPARSGARPAPMWPLVGGDCPAHPLPGAALPTLDRQVCRLRLCPRCLRPLPGPSKPQGQPASGQGRAHSTRRPRRGPSPKAGGLWEGQGPRQEHRRKGLQHLRSRPKLGACRLGTPASEGAASTRGTMTLGEKGLGASGVSGPSPRTDSGATVQ